MNKKIGIYCCYAREDQVLLLKLKGHLTSLQQEGLISLWTDTDIGAGAERESEIHQHLNNAQIILLLVSADFMSSKFDADKEVLYAMERHKLGESQIIPIIMRHVDWETSWIGKFEPLPTGAKPVVSSDWTTEDEAFLNVARGVRKAVEERIRKAVEAEQACLLEEEQARYRVEVERMSKFVEILRPHLSYEAQMLYQEGSLQQHQKALCELFQFSVDDLACNQRGLLSDRQVQWVSRRKAQKNFLSIMFCCVLIVFGVAVLVILWGDPWYISLWFLLILSGIITLLLFDLAQKWKEKLPPRHIECIEGRIDPRDHYEPPKSRYGSGGHIYYYVIKGQLFEVSKAAYNTLFRTIISTIGGTAALTAFLEAIPLDRGVMAMRMSAKVFVQSFVFRKFFCPISWAGKCSSIALGASDRFAT